MRGYEDWSVSLKDNSQKCASVTLVLMIVSVDSNSKIPVVYFLISSLNRSEKANIVEETLKKLHETGVTVISVTCDGPAVNFSMAEQLSTTVQDI